MRSLPRWFLVFVAVLAATALTPMTEHATAQVAWFPETVDEGGYVGTYPSLAIDSTGRPHVVYLDEGVGAVKYATLVAGSWEIEEIERSYVVSGPTSLVLDTGDRPHVSYATAGRLHYASRDATRWNMSVVDLVYDEPSSSLAIGRDGRPRIAYVWDTGTLRFARWDGVRWVIENVPTEGLVIRHVSLALDGVDQPHLSLFGNGNLRYVRQSVPDWFEEVVDAARGAGWFSRLALNDRGWPRIAYYDSQSRDPMFAAWDGISRTWHREVVDPEGDAGWDLDLALDANDVAHLSYYNRNLGDIRYARQGPSGWVWQTVDSEGVVGWYTSIALGPGRLPWVAYFDWTRAALRVASSSIEFQVRTIAAEGIGTDRVTLRGELACLGSFPSATLSFHWRAEGTGAWNISSLTVATSSGTFRHRIENLTAATTYEFRAVGESNGSVVYGEIVKFRTGGLPSALDASMLVVLVVAVAGTGIAAALFARRVIRRRAARQRGLRGEMARDQMPRP